MLVHEGRPALSPRNVWGQLWLLMRPRQWLKNGFVLAGLIFSRQALIGHQWIGALGTVLAFCLFSSTVYIWNDLHDLAQDRQHPTKRMRPLARGAISRRTAMIHSVGLMALGFLVLALSVPHRGVWGAGALFLVTNVIYTMGLRRVFLLDTLTISAGFLIRTWAGVLAVGVPMSPWLFLLVLELTLFMALGKRRGELLALGDASGRHRVVLNSYSPGLLQQFLPILVSSIITTYGIYGFFSPEGHHRLMLTVPFVIYGLFRYLYLLERSAPTDNPDELVVGDRPTLINIGAWVATVFAILYVVR